MALAKPEFIEYNGKKIFYLNFSNMEKNDVPVFLEEAKQLLMPNPPASVLFLANVLKMKFDPATVKNFIEFFKFTKAYTKKTAVIGLDTIKKMLYEAALKISGRGSENIKILDGYDAEVKAKDWLTI